MPIRIVGDQDANEIDIPVRLIAELNGLIELQGAGASIRIADDCVVRNRLVIIASAGTVITIGAGCVIGDLEMASFQGAALWIDDHVSFNGRCRLQAHETAGISIGDGCLIASDTNFTSSDMHSIVDALTGRRVNPSADIVVGARVWIAEGAKVMKGARIGDGSIIGAGSTVTGTIPPNCAAAGNPARVIRTGVTWDQRLLAMEPEPLEVVAPERALPSVLPDAAPAATGLLSRLGFRKH